ncbi:ferredoxin reductase [Aquihabitans sp. G128]|uniref:ferredoxin reductase n=1 Tax=Aquihabitans sp. G128 TaxID=2849779 RepID=UPI001C227475|nr:ferredoxin reductase [Aquihabitans sp. G128]QXC59296.1 ferredoxin reductase [Aquihabitans sp. G128]
MVQTLTPARPRGLVRRALASDLVDKLTAPHGVDRYLELVDPRWVVRETRAEVTSAVRQTDGTVTLTLRPNDTWAGFRAGQHVVVGVDIDGVVHQRCFSLAGSPHRADGSLELTVKANPDGRVSRHLVGHARAGMVLRLSEAKGDFTLPEPDDRRDHLVFISGGSGITPVLSMLRTLVDEGHAGPVTFVHYGLTEGSVCYLDELRMLTAALPQGRLLLGLTEDDERTDLVGFYGPEHLAAIVDDPADARIFLCGPAPLMASVEAHHADLGLSDRVHLERFGLPPVDPSLDAGDGIVAFERSGTRVAASGTLLETAEAAGLSPAFGCRRGICGTCTTTKTAGVVRNVVTGEASAADAEPIRLCVSVACGEVAVAL